MNYDDLARELPAAPDPYDDPLLGDKQQAMRVNVLEGSANPDAEARVQAFARKYGLPVDAVRLNLPDVERRDRLGSMDYERMARELPATSALLADGDKSKVVLDDVAGLSALERVFLGKVGSGQASFGAVDGPAYRYTGQVKALERGALGAVIEPLRRGWETGGNVVPTLLEELGLLSGWHRQRAEAAASGGMPYSPTFEAAQEMAANNRRAERFPPPDDVAQGLRAISGAKTFGEAAGAIWDNPSAVLETTLQSLGAVAPVMAAGAAGSVIAGPWGAALAGGSGSAALEYASTLQDTLGEAGVNTSDPAALNAALNNPELMAEARNKGLRRGITIGMFDAITAGFAGRLLAGAAPTARSMGARAAGEIAVQAGGGAAGEASAQALTGEFKPGDVLLEAIAELPTSLHEVPLNMRHGALRAQHLDAVARWRAQDAERSARTLAELNTLAQASKVLARDPETFQQFVAAATEDGPLQAVYIDGQTLMQSGLAEQVAAVSPAVAEQVQQAAQTGGAVAIPVAEYATHIAPTELAQQLQPHLRTEADGFSQAEARQYMQSQGEQLQADLDRAVADSQQGDAFRASADVVTGQVRQQLDAAGRFTPQVNDAYARVVGAYYATRAAQLGVTPEALFERRRLTVGAESVAGEVLNQGAESSAVRAAMAQWTRSLSGVRLDNFRHAAHLPTSAALKALGVTDKSLEFPVSAILKIAGKHPDVPPEVVQRLPELVSDPLFIFPHPEGGQNVVLDATTAKGEPIIVGVRDGRVRTITPQNDDNALTGQERLAQKIDAAVSRGEKVYARNNEALVKTRASAPASYRTNPVGSLARNRAIVITRAALVKLYGEDFYQGSDQTDTPEFKRWFGDSKAVDAEGKPLVFYHGGDPDFTGVRAGGRFGGAIFAREGQPSGYGQEQHALYVKGPILELQEMANLLDSDSGRVALEKATQKSLSDDEAEALAEALTDGSNYPDDQATWDLIGAIDEADAQLEIQKLRGAVARELGFQVVRTPDEFDGETVMILSPEQIKSATGNNGQFDPNDPNILNQSASQDGAVALRALADEGNNQAIVAQALVDRAGFGPKQFADVLEGAALGAQPDGLVGVPAFAAMLSHMRSAVLDDLKVLDAIVGSVPVDMVNNLAGSESAAKVLLHDEAMNEDSPAFNADLMVANGVDTSNPVGLLVREAALAAAKVASVTLNNGRESSEAGAAILAGDGNSFSQSARLPRAAFHPSTNTITLLDNADLTSFLHESAHFFFENDIALASEIVAAQRDGASIKPGEQQLLADVGQLLTWHGLKGDVAAQLTEWHNMPFEEKRALHERTAESFEAYLFEGKAPSIELAPYFQRFRSWLLSVYRSLKDFLAGHPEAGTLTPEVRAVFDRMLATNEAILMAEQGRSMLALFETAAQAGMSPEAWAAYQAQGNQATQDAVQDLQARGLRDLQWLKGARSRMLKKLQGEAKAARDAAAVDVRREVMAEPVYRAWRFLTGRLQDEDRIGEPPAPPKPGAGLNREVDSLLTAIAKLGGISRASAAEHLGVHADDFRRNSGVFGKRLFLKEGGLSADAMAELLLSEGYLRADENGLADLRELEELVAGELGGAPHYSAFRDPSLAFEEARAGDQVQDPSQLGAGRLDVASLREMYGRNAALENAIPTRRAATFEEAAEKAGAFIGKELTNKATKKTATVSKGTLRKMLSASAARKSVSAADHALAVANVDKLFAAAVLDHSHADARGEPTIVAIHRFMAPMIGGDGNVLLVKLTVKETKGEGEPNPLYSVEALDVKKPTREAPVETGIERVPGTENGVAEHPTGGLSSSVARRLAEVNDAASRTPEWQRLTSHGMTATKGALHPDVAADILGGFDSGDALVQALLAATPLDEEIEARIDQRMLEQHGELATPEALEAAADAAIHSEARGRMVATELAALTKATGAPKVLADAARQFAAAAIARLKVRNLTPSMFSNAQAKAARNAAAALKKGDLALAAAEKRNEILQHYSAKAAHEARDEIERGRKYLAGFDGDVKGLDAGYLDQIAALLERFDLRKGTSLRAADKRKSLAAWLEAQREAGMEPDVPAELQNEAFTKSYKDMTVEEFRGLRDTVKQIEHLGRLKHKLLTAADQRAFDAVRDEIAASIGQHANGAAPEQSTPATDAGARKLKAHQFFLSHLKVANIAQRMDGGETGGPVWTFFARSAQERANWKAAKQAELTGKLMEIMRPVLARAGQFRTARARPALGISLTQEQVFALALNMGNEGNISRLLTGGINGRHFSHGQLVQLIDDELTAADLAAVQAIWDLMAELTPEAQAKHKRLYGREMELVAPTPLVTKHGTLRGGYYPIVYDPRGSVRVGENEADAVAKDALRAAHTAATTRRSYTKARLDETPYPLILTMGGVHRGLSQVVHDLAWHEWSMDVGRMLRDKTFQAAVLETYGLDYLKALQGWHEDIVTENVREQAGWERFGVHLRASVPAAAMGYSLLTAIQQPIGLTQSMARLGSGAVFKALAGFVGSPRAKITKARELSAFMRSRGITRFREVADLKRQIDLTGNRLRQAHSAVAEHAFDLLGWVQTCVDVPTWHAAFEKATAEGKDQATAVAVADQAVIDTQGDGAIQNLSGVQRDRFGKWLTLFYSYLSGALNMIWQTAHSERSLPRKTADILMLTMVPATLTALIKWAVKPGDDDDDEKYWKLVQQIMKENISLPLSMFVGIRELSDQAASLMVGEPVFSYQGPGSFRVVAETAKLLGQVSQGELDAGLGRSVINVAGSVTGLPSTQINRTIQGAQALADGETQNPAAVAFGFQKPR